MKQSSKPLPALAKGQTVLLKQASAVDFSRLDAGASNNMIYAVVEQVTANFVTFKSPSGVTFTVNNHDLPKQMVDRIKPGTLATFKKSVIRKYPGLPLTDVRITALAPDGVTLMTDSGTVAMPATDFAKYIKSVKNTFGMRKPMRRKRDVEDF